MNINLNSAVNSKFQRGGYSSTDYGNEFQKSVNNTKINIKNDIVVGERRYYLTPSKSKYVSVGLCRDFGFKPCIIIGGCRGEQIMFDEKQWQEMCDNSQTILNLFYGSNDYNPVEAVHTSSHIIAYETFKDIQIVKVSNRLGNYIYLGQETTGKLFEVKSLILHTIATLKKFDFAKYLSLMLEEVKQSYGTIKENILKKISSSHCDNTCILFELVTQYPDISEFQLQAPNYYSENGNQISYFQ